MNKKNNTINKHFIEYTRKQWAERNFLNNQNLQKDIVQFKKINKNITLQEINDIYLPLSKLLDFNINRSLQKKSIIKSFISTNQNKVPYIIGIIGSVAVGKSTTARLIQEILYQNSENRVVELITTDNFLYPNKILKKLGLMNKKGFPQTYDMKSLIQFVIDIKSGLPKVIAPIYSHLIYDVIPCKHKIITQPDILILEGLNILQSNINYFPNVNYISDFIDFSIYIDAPELLIQTWYINRFLKFRQYALTDPYSYFYKYSKFSKQEVIKIATNVWQKINLLNLKENIVPTKEKANLIIYKGYKHMVQKIYLKNYI